MNSIAPIVSVIITCYNSENYIEDSIVSVIENDFQDIEIIIVDDNSTDDSLRIIRKYEKLDNRVRVFVNSINLGDYPNRNFAAGQANGKYIKYLDSDDILYPHGLKSMVNSMELYPDAGLGMMWGDPIFEPSPVLVPSKKAYELYFIHDQWLCVGPSGSIYRKDCFFKVGGFSEMPYISDVDLNLRLAANYPVLRLHYDLVFYRIREGQQLSLGENINGYPKLRYLVDSKSLNSFNCPLELNQKILVQRKINRRQSKIVVKYFLKSLKVKDMKVLVVDSGMGWKRFFLSLFDFSC